MSEHLTIPQLRKTTQETQEWFNDLSARDPFENHEQAYSFFRAVIHAVRDRLTAEEAAHLASQLPMLMQGIYWEGWRPALAPNDFKTEEEFLDRVKLSLRGDKESPGLDVKAGAVTVLAFLADRVDSGQMHHVTHQLPQQIRDLFPEKAYA